MEHGKITAVNYEDGVVTCNVQAIRRSNEYRNVPVMKPFGGMYRTPKPGQLVAMDSLNDGTRFIIGYIARDSSDTPPEDMKPEELVFRVDDETVIEMRQNPDGSYDLNLGASGDVTINGEVQ